MEGRAALSSPRPWLVLLVLLVIVPTVAITVYTGLGERRRAASRAEADAQRLTRLVVGAESQLVDGTRGLLAALAALPQVRRGERAACDAFVRDLSRRAAFHGDLAVAGRDGVVFCHTLLAAAGQESVATHRFFQTALRTRETTPGDYQVDPISGKPTVTFGYPVVGAAGDVDAVVFASLDLVWLNRTLAQVPLPERAAITIVDASGTIVGHAPGPDPWVGMAMPYVPIVRAMLGRAPGMIEETGLDGIRRLYAFAPIGDARETGLFVAVGVSRDAAVAEVSRPVVWSLVWLAIAGCLAMGAAWIAERRLDAVTATMEAEQQAKESLVAQVSDLVSQRAHEVALLNQMGALLQACVTTEEAVAVVGRLVGQFFPEEAGALLLIDPEGTQVERVAVWGARAAEGPPLFTPDECWALRRGQAYVVEDTATGLVCPHLGLPFPAAYLCLPLATQGESLGVLHLASEAPSGEASTTGLTETTQRLATVVAEHLGLALANLRLRETLRSQSIRDALTGLFNRRYMEETLGRELLRAERGRHPVGILLLDVDHFKRFNDNFGHDGGDAVLGALGALLKASTRGGDIACRHGGEEFAVILPGASGAETRRRAEDLREAARDLQVWHRGVPIGPVTFSMGLAAYPDHGSTAEALLRAADAALYRAKHEGRDQVVLAE